MASQDLVLDASGTRSPLGALAEQLRDGPLQRLVELQMQTTSLADRLAEGAPAKIEDVEQLVRLSMAAMQHFNAFTRELSGVLRQLTDAAQQSH